MKNLYYNLYHDIDELGFPLNNNYLLEAENMGSPITSNTPYNPKEDIYGFSKLGAPKNKSYVDMQQYQKQYPEAFTTNKPNISDPTSEDEALEDTVGMEEDPTTPPPYNPNPEDPDVYEEPDDPFRSNNVEINNYYDLKKLYSRLISLNRQLNSYSEKNAIKLNKDVMESIDLFHILITNYDTYKDNISLIIKQYSRFIEQVTIKYSELLLKKKNETEFKLNI